MSVDRTTVEQMAKLARIRIPEEQLESLAGELSNILGWIEQLNELETAGVEPMTSVVEMRPSMREDVVSDGGIMEKVMHNAPEGAPEYFAVPKVVE